MIWILVISLLLTTLLGVFSFIQIRARIKLQRILGQMMLKMHKALYIMRQVDNTGAFEAHDVVGETFVLLVTAIQELRNYFVQQVGSEEREETKK